MKKFIPMAVVAACVASVAFASIRQPAATVSNTEYAVVDTVPAQQEDTTQVPTQETPAPADTGTATDTSSASY